MAGNVFTYQVLKDTTEHAIIKLTGQFDGTGQESNAHRIPVQSLYGALDANGVPLWSGLSVSNTPLNYYGTTVSRVWYDTWPYAGDVSIYWAGDTQQNILIVNGNGEYDGEGNWITIAAPNTAISNCNGDIGVTTRGAVANCSYTLILELRKQNEYFQRGQFNDPAAFNYGAFGVKP